VKQKIFAHRKISRENAAGSEQTGTGTPSPWVIPRGNKVVLMVGRCSPVAISMPIKCSQKKQKYTSCGHTVYEYKHCGGGHPDTPDENEACYEDWRSGPGTSETPKRLPGFCTRFCQAEQRGWYCKKCSPDGEHVRGKVNDNGILVHETANGEEHVFTVDCIPADV